MKKLPLGIQTFSKIIEGNYIYIDKTREILDLINGGQYFFLSRPRRFGKSLLLSTLKEIFSGNKELFAGLYIYDKIQWETYPVIHLDFSLIPRDTDKRLKQGLIDKLRDTALRYNIELLRKDYDTSFNELIGRLSEKFNKKAVILIDEYDKPIIDHITDREKANKNREILRDFYTMLKGSDEYIKFVLLTGVSKFSKVSIFSGLNNLMDITLDNRFSTMLGITEEELLKYFPENIRELSIKDEVTEERILKDIKYWYNGYSWDGVNFLYNPFSLLNLFATQKFGNFWFKTGTPTFLMNLLREYKIEIPEIENVTVSEYILDSYDIEDLDINSLLLQTGYLTIKEIIKHNRLITYKLSYPNFEVKESLINYILADFLNTQVPVIQPLHIRMADALKNDNLEEFSKLIKSLMAGIPSKLHLKREAYYQSVFYMILSLMGVRIDLELLTDKGIVDGVIEFLDKIYVVEFKYGKSGSKMNKLLDDAIKQIKERKYYEKYLKTEKSIILLGAGFIGKSIGFKIEKLIPGGK